MLHLNYSYFKILSNTVLSNANFGKGYKGTGAHTALFATL